MGPRPGAREFAIVVVLALAGVVLAAGLVFGPWFPGPSAPEAVVVELVSPGGVAGRP